jgi:hypothetical protein
MQVTVSMNAEGVIWVTTPQGALLAEGFFKAEDESAEALRDMGYQSLRERYPAAQIVAGRGMAVEDLVDVFLEG